MQNIHFGNNQAKIDYIRNRYNKTVDLVMEKVAAHFENPGLYPLPLLPGSAEKALYDLVAAIPQHRRKKFIDRHNNLAGANAAKRREIYRDLASVNLQSNLAIAEQVKKLEIPADKIIRQAEADHIIGIIRQTGKQNTGYSTGKKKPAAVTRAALPLANRFSVFADTLTCNKTSEFRKDEISMAGFAIDAFGGQQDKTAFFVGDFKQGDSISLAGNAKLFDLNLDVLASGSGFPQSLSLTLFLVEKDFIHNLELSDKLTKAAFALWALFLAITIGLIVVGMLGGPATVLMAMIAVTISISFLIIGIQLIPLITDDVSLLATDTLIVDVQPTIGETTSRSLNFQLSNSLSDGSIGDYTAAIRWEAIA